MDNKKGHAPSFRKRLEVHVFYSYMLEMESSTKDAIHACITSFFRESYVIFQCDVCHTTDPFSNKSACGDHVSTFHRFQRLKTNLPLDSAQFSYLETVTNWS